MPKHPDSRLTFQQDDSGDATIGYAPTPGSSFMPAEVHLQRDQAAWLWPILKAYAEGQDIVPDAGDAELRAEAEAYDQKPKWYPPKQLPLWPPSTEAEAYDQKPKWYTSQGCPH